MTVPDLVNGIILSRQEVSYTLRAFEVLLRNRRPSPQLAEFLARLARSAAASDVGREKPYGGVSLGDNDHDPAGWLPGDVLDTDEAAAVLGISPAGVRDLARRGRLPAKRAGKRWLLAAAPVVARAERNASR